MSSITSYTLDRRGGRVTTYDSNNNGKAYKIDLEDSNGVIVLYNSHHDDFPHFPKELISWKNFKLMYN